VPSWQVAHCLADGRLRIVLEAYQRPPTPLSILTLRNRLLLPKVRAFADFAAALDASATASLILSDGRNHAPVSPGRSAQIDIAHVPRDLRGAHRFQWTVLLGAREFEDLRPHRSHRISRSRIIITRCQCGAGARRFALGCVCHSWVSGRHAHCAACRQSVPSNSRRKSGRFEDSPVAA